MHHKELKLALEKVNQNKIERMKIHRHNLSVNVSTDANKQPLKLKKHKSYFTLLSLVAVTSYLEITYPYH